MLLTTLTSPALPVLDTGIYAIMGYALVFTGLALLMLVVMLFGRIFTASAKKSAPVRTVVENVPAPAPEAPGSAGSLKLYNVDPKTAAMLMAIVADKMGKPINELRFISIKEVSK